MRKFIISTSNVTLCLANDGSVDNTLILLQSLQKQFPDRVIVIDNELNKGKGETIRSSMLKMLSDFKFNYIGYMDADLSTPFEEIYHLFINASTHDKNILTMGCRLKRIGADVIRPNGRHYLGRVFATFVSLSLGLPIYDTQCGAKVLKTEALATVFQKPFFSKWFFDVELIKRLLIVYQKSFCKTTIMEIPLNKWHAVKGSKIKPIYYFKAPFELLKIHINYSRPHIIYDQLEE